MRGGGPAGGAPSDALPSRSFGPLRRVTCSGSPPFLTSSCFPLGEEQRPRGSCPSRNVRRERAQGGGAGISGMRPQVAGAPTGRSAARPRTALSAPPLREGGFALGAGMSLRVTGSGFFHRSRVVSHASLRPAFPSAFHLARLRRAGRCERCRAGGRRPRSFYILSILQGCLGDLPG